jgi:hypothetical protein
MTQYKAPLRDMRFLMNDVLDYPAHYASCRMARMPTRRWSMPSSTVPPSSAKTCSRR